MGRQRRPKRFSAVQAVKNNARARLGTPPPGTVIPDRVTKAAHRPEKHKRSIEDVIRAAQEDPAR